MPNKHERKVEFFKLFIVNVRAYPEEKREPNLKTLWNEYLTKKINKLLNADHKLKVLTGR